MEGVEEAAQRPNLLSRILRMPLNAEEALALDRFDRGVEGARRGAQAFTEARDGLVVGGGDLEAVRAEDAREPRASVDRDLVACEAMVVEELLARVGGGESSPRSSGVP